MIKGRVPPLSLSFLQRTSSGVQLEQCVADGGRRLRAQVGEEEGDVGGRSVVHQRVGGGVVTGHADDAVAPLHGFVRTSGVSIAPLELLGNVRLVEREEADELVALRQHVEGLVVRLCADGQLVGADLWKQK